MAQAQSHQPHFLFSVTEIQQSPEWNDRIEGGKWQPPRPLGSNIVPSPTTADKYYRFRDGRVRELGAPTSGWKSFRTCSFYYSDGKIYVYPADATGYAVGDRQGNSRRTRATTNAPEVNSSSDDSDVDDTHTYDWRSLNFVCPVNSDESSTSYACFRGEPNGVRVLRDHQQLKQTIAELLPNEYLRQASKARPTHTANGIPCGGIVGQLPILIALVAYSVPVADVEATLINHFSHPYRPHGGRRSAGCKCSYYIVLLSWRAESQQCCRDRAPGPSGASAVRRRPQDTTTNEARQCCETGSARAV